MSSVHIHIQISPGGPRRAGGEEDDVPPLELLLAVRMAQGRVT